MNRKKFIAQALTITAGYGLLPYRSKASSNIATDEWEVPKELQDEMYKAAISIAKQKIRGGDKEPFFKQPFLDAAFNGNIFLWDSCFMACYAKFHQHELPVANALDNFYKLQEADGYICREYTPSGKPMWPKDHPVSINPPLLAFAELELYSQSKNKERLKKVYPALKRFYAYIVRHYRMEDDLFFNDAFGSGMDNIPRYPDGWQDDGQGITITNLYPEIFVYDGLSPVWNKQGRSVDMSAQMALYAEQLSEIATLIGIKKDIAAYKTFYERTKAAINKYCWNEADGFYYDLGYGKQIKRMHIGMFWVLIAGIVPKEKLQRVISHLTNPNKFWRKFPVASYPADQKDFSPAGSYWLGSVWTPSNYMIIKGLLRYNEKALATRLARQYYWSVAEVYKTTHTFWENYAPDAIEKGNQARPDFCGWTAIVPITLYHEFINEKK